MLFRSKRRLEFHDGIEDVVNAADAFPFQRRQDFHRKQGLSLGLSKVIDDFHKCLLFSQQADNAMVLGLGGVGYAQQVIIGSILQVASVPVIPVIGALIDSPPPAVEHEEAAVRIQVEILDGEVIVSSVMIGRKNIRDDQFGIHDPEFAPVRPGEIGRAHV